MIKFTYETDDGKTIVGFGLTDENIKRLRAGEPINIDGAKFGMEEVDKVIIFYGATEKIIFEKLKEKGLISPDTVVHGEPPGEA